MLMSRACGCVRVLLALVILTAVASPTAAQGLGGAGTVKGP
jgi:hypothetical protein